MTNYMNQLDIFTQDTIYTMANKMIYDDVVYDLKYEIFRRDAVEHTLKTYFIGYVKLKPNYKRIFYNLKKHTFQKPTSLSLTF